MAGLLALFLCPAFPSGKQTVACGGQNVTEDNSCGNSSGFTPDSLLRHHRQKAEVVTNIGAKVREVWEGCYIVLEKLPTPDYKLISQNQARNKKVVLDRLKFPCKFFYQEALQQGKIMLFYRGNDS